MIIPYSMIAVLKAAYYLDFVSQRFGNSLAKAKEPFVYLGATEAVEPDFDPKLVSDHYRVSNGEFFTIGAVDYGWDSSWFMRPATHILKLRLVALPQRGQKELVYTFLSDKTLPISITYDRRFVVGEGSQVFTTKTFGVPLNQFFYLRLVYNRMLYTQRYYDCSVEIEVIGYGRDGGDLKCKQNFEIKYVILIFRFEVTDKTCNRREL